VAILLSTNAVDCIIEEETLMPGTFLAPRLNSFDTERWKFSNCITMRSIRSFRQLLWRKSLVSQLSGSVSDPSMNH